MEVNRTNFDQAFLKYHHSLLLYTLKFIEDEQEALDLVQDIFVTLWEKGNLNQKEEQVKAYLFTSVKNNCLNYLKHQKVVRKFEQHLSVQLRESELAYYQSGEKSLIEQEDLTRIEEAIASLGDIYKEVIFLSRMEGLKNNEIAERLNIPVRTVETRLFRALSTLKEKISTRSFLILLYFSALIRENQP